MTACAGNLTKSTNTTYIPGNPGVPATAGSPYIPARCYWYDTNVCAWIPNPAVTYRYRTEGGITYLDYLLNGSVFASVPLPFSSFYTNTLNGVDLYIYACTTISHYVCTPAVAAVPGTPGIPATPSQTIISLNVGWNTHSRTIGALENETYLKFTVDPSNTGLFMGVDTVGKDAQQLYSFDHGMMFDPSGVWVFENGAQVTQLLGVFSGTTEMHIERRDDGTIKYVAGAESYISTTTVSPAATLYVYGQMYSGNDRVLCASWQDLTATTYEETVTLSGAGTFKLASPSVDGTFFADLTMSGAGTLSADSSVKDANGVILTVVSAGWMGLGNSELIITPTATAGLAYFPALTAFGSESADYMLGDSSFPALTISGNCYELYVPATATTGYGNLPLMASSGIVISVDYCQGDADFPALQAIGGDYAYAVGSASFPPLAAWGDEGVVGEMWMMSSSYMFDTHDQAAELVLVILSDGTLASVYSDSVIKIQEYISALLGASVQDMSGTYDFSQLSALRVVSLQVMTLTGQAALDQVGRVWVVNMESAASTQYDNYGFNSFFVRDGESYGVADDGIYRLSGDTDLSADIAAQINLGSTRLNTTVDKRLPAVYINAASDGKMILKIEVDGSDPYYYEARSSSEELDNHRVDPGRGLRGNNWTFTLMNQDGDDFELAHLEFVPLQGTRRI